MTWATVRLEQVARLINGDRGKNYPSDVDFVEHGVPFINAGHLRGGRVDFSKMNYISESRFERLGSGKTQENDIVYCLRGSLGKTAIIERKGDAAIASSLVIIRPIAECHVGYLYYFLASPFGRLEMGRFVNGSSQPNLSAESVKSYRVPLPPLAEQRRIAAILDKADQLQTKRWAALKQLTGLTQAMFLEMFGDPATNPKGWRLAPLATACSISGEYGSGVASVSYDPSLPRYVRITDIGDEGALLPTRVSPAGTAADWQDLFLQDGDVLFARSGATVGKTFKYSSNDGPCVFAGYLIRFRPDRSALLPETLFHFTRTPAYRKWVAIRQRVVAQPNINAQQYGFELKVPLPPVDLQREFAKRVSAVEAATTLQFQATEQHDELFASLQHRAFSGEL